MRPTLLATLLIFGTSGVAGAQTAPNGPPPGPGGPGGRVFISPMGEPFHGADRGAPQDQWFAGADADHDGVLTSDEMTADAARFFAMLDRGHDGEIDPDDIDHYETVIAPEIRVQGMGGGGGGERRGSRGGPPGGGMGGGGGPGGGMGGGGMGGRRGGGGPGGDRADSQSSGPKRDVTGKQGAARFGYLDYPEPVTSADRNLNRGVDVNEFRIAAAARFALLDINRDGRLETTELPRLEGKMGGPGRRGGKPPKRPDGGD
ncbi:EF-hand domain-containing protein [Sphingomonas sp. PB4P5]|uniref:EF-hand domain-containing protein n=1 Tax=Parasphingomonas puruogangriensis TaxID=3096155 RepID=UPI002FC8E219